MNNSDTKQTEQLNETAVSVSALTPMHKMINYLCETGNYDLVDKANELLFEERSVIEKAFYNGIFYKRNNITTASSDYYKSMFIENTTF